MKVAGSDLPEVSSEVLRDRTIVTTMILEPFQPWFAPKYALVRQIIYLCTSNPGVIFFSDPAGKVWYVRQTKQISLHLLAETPDSNVYLSDAISTQRCCNS